MRSVQMPVQHNVTYLVSQGETIAGNAISIDIFINIDVFHVARGKPLHFKLSLRQWVAEKIRRELKIA